MVVSVDYVKSFDSRLVIRKGKIDFFVNTGNVYSRLDCVATYAMNKLFFDEAMKNNNVSVLFCKDEDITQNYRDDISLVISDDPQFDFFLFHNHLVSNTIFYGGASESKISKQSKIDDTVIIPQNNVFIDDDVIVHQNVTFIGRVKIGSGTILSPGVVVGMDGARIVQSQDGVRLIVLHGGSIEIGRKVFVGANSVIMRSVWKCPTTIGNNVYIGNLVNIGHNTIIEDGAMILPGNILSGGITVGENSRLWVSSCFRDHVTIGKNADVSMGTVVTKSVMDSSRVSGNPSMSHHAYIKHTKEVANV